MLVELLPLLEKAEGCGWAPTWVLAGMRGVVGFVEQYLQVLGKGSLLLFLITAEDGERTAGEWAEAMRKVADEVMIDPASRIVCRCGTSVPQDVPQDVPRDVPQALRRLHDRRRDADASAISAQLIGSVKMCVLESEILVSRIHDMPFGDEYLSQATADTTLLLSNISRLRCACSIGLEAAVGKPWAVRARSVIDG